jgi:hypothetical protein
MPARHVLPPYAEVVRFVWHARPPAIQGSVGLVRYAIHVKVVIPLSVRRVRFVIHASRRAIQGSVPLVNIVITVRYVLQGNRSKL